MARNDDIAEKIATILKAALPAPDSPASSPPAATQQINLGNHAVQIAGDLCIIKSGPQYLTEAQAYELHRLINQAVALESQTGGDRKQLFAKWYTALKRRFQATSYKTIPAAQADAALSWLRQHVARLRRCQPTNTANPSRQQQLRPAKH